MTMSKSSQTKDNFLGIPYGTACNQLRKTLLFKFVKKASGGKIKCWDCKKSITKVSDFSIQHKKPWLHEDPDLFWDLRNIAFSHLKCNKPNRRRNAEKTHCPQGHEYVDGNLVITKTGRKCRICQNKECRTRLRKARSKDPKYGRKS